MLQAMHRLRVWRSIHLIVPCAALLAGCGGHHSLSGAPGATGAHVASGDSLSAAISRRIAAVSGAAAGVYYRAVDAPGDTVTVSADARFHAASTMKVPVMIQVYRDAEAGRLSLSQTVVVRNRFASIVDGSPYTLDPKDDSDSGMYDVAGHTMTVHDLMLRMIQRSSNLATNTVIGLVGAARADSTAHALGATHIHVLRGVEDGKAFDRGLNNTVSARDLGALLLAIQQDRAATPATVRRCVTCYSGRSSTRRFPRVCHRGHGWPTRPGRSPVSCTTRPWSIRRAPPYVLVVLTSGIPDERVARAMIVDISRMVYAHFMGGGR